MALKIGFTCVVFVVAFSGTRALAILHLFLVVPSIVSLLAFCLQGLWWLSLSDGSSSFLHVIETKGSTSVQFVDWAKWYFIATWNIYSLSLIHI
uniref:Uncharacterized protein n=1 Tax=Tolypothrix bouteillei VB521301 TaxID=1479485 RepID=A0A0C1R5I9_9CYAN